MDKTKLILVVSLIGTIILLIFLTKSIFEIKSSLNEAKHKLEASSIQMKQLDDSIARSQSSYVTSDQLEKSLSDLGLHAIQADLDRLNAKIDAINIVLISTPGFIGTNIGSTSTKPKPKNDPIVPPVIPCTNGECINPDKFNYLNNEQFLAINEPFTDGFVPFGSTSFKAWEQKPWSLNILPRNYSISNVVSQDEDGQMIVYNKFNIEVDGKKYPIKIKDSKTIQELRGSEFWFNPRLQLGVGVGPVVYPKLTAEVVPTLQVSLFSYGPHRRQTTWNFLGLGIGMHTQNPSPVVSISPVNYNIGEPLPLLENLFIGPTLSVDISGNISIAGSVQVGL